MRVVAPFVLFAAFSTAACESSTGNARPPSPAPGGYTSPYAAPAPPYGAPGYAPGPAGPYPYAQNPSGLPPYTSQYGTPPYGVPSGSPPPAYGAPAPVSNAPMPAAPVLSDPINDVDPSWLRARTAALVQELVAALPDVAKARVVNVPLTFDDTPGEVNAAAACVRSGPVLIVTDGLLDIAAHLAAARANDDVFGTNKVVEYVSFVAREQKPNQPIVRPAPGFFDPRQVTDARRVARQHDVFDELVGFVVGHELSHHHLGHLPCTGQPGPFGLGEIARGLSSALPLFNQPNELAADASGTNNVLVAGAMRPGYHLTEGGALLIMQFFSAIDQLSPEDILFGFERTHPPPSVRAPVIQQTAATWRRAGGGWLPVVRF